MKKCFSFQFRLVLLIYSISRLLFDFLRPNIFSFFNEDFEIYWKLIEKLIKNGLIKWSKQRAIEDYKTTKRKNKIAPKGLNDVAVEFQKCVTSIEAFEIKQTTKQDQQKQKSTRRRKINFN